MLTCEEAWLWEEHSRQREEKEPCPWGVAWCLICLRLSKVKAGCKNKVREKEMSWERKASVEESRGLLQR